MEQQTNDWFIDKLGRFSASDAKTIITKGEGLKTLAYKKCIERILSDREDGIQTEAMERGVNLEPIARELYEEKSKNKVEEVGFIIHDEWSGCSPDGFVGLDGGIEIKCMNSHHHLVAFLYDYIKKEHYAQIQMCLMITGRQWWDYVIFNPDLPDNLQFKTIRVLPDEDMFVKIKDGIEKGKEIAQQGLDNYKSLTEEINDRNN